jgi:peptidoglycan/xylan/chitin deacetylase (PgdA/CDA1 family)
MTETLFVLTNDDAGMQAPELFAELLDFLKAQEAPATFFVVPFAGQQAVDEKPEWRVLLDRALDEGHDLQHHGLTHTSAFEVGVPPRFMLDIMPENKAKWEQEPAQFTQHHAHNLLREKLIQGRSILTRTFGYEPEGFRSPCLAVCDNLYQALHELEYGWSSNQVINPMGWRYINRDYDAGEPWQPEVPAHPYSYNGLLTELPMHSEYTWYLEEEDIDRHFALAKSDLDRARAQGEPFVALSHYYAMTGRWAAGLQVYERLFAYARERGDVRFATLRQLAAE